MALSLLKCCREITPSLTPAEEELTVVVASVRVVGCDFHQRAAGQSRSPVQAAAGTQVGTREPVGVHQRPYCRQLRPGRTDSVDRRWLGKHHIFVVGYLVDVRHQQEHPDACAEVLQ